MSANPDHSSSSQPERHGSVSWIGRDRTSQSGGPEFVEPAANKARNRIIGGAVTLLIVLAALAARHLNQPASPDGVRLQPSQLPLVRVISPAVEPVRSTVSFSGTIHARYDMHISAEGESGRIIAVPVEAGDRVRRGQVLARLDQSVLRPQMDRLEASLEEAKAQAALSAAEYRRAQSLEGSGAMSAQEIERRQATSVTHAVKVKVAAAQLAEARARLGKTEILAPADGLVLTRSAEVGQTASPGGEPLFRLARDGEMEMRGQVAERDLVALSVNQAAQVYLTAIEKPFAGQVRLLGAVIDPQSRLGEIRIALEPSAQLRPGAFARAEVVVASAQRPVLPQTAVLSDAQGTYVFVVTDESKAERRAVRIGGTIPEGIVISEGLTGNEQVVATAGAFLRAGEQVTVAEAKRVQI